MSFNSNYPSIEALKARAKKRMPGFAYDYLDGGCFSEVNLQRNTSDIRDVQLKPYYLRVRRLSFLVKPMMLHLVLHPWAYKA